MDDNNNISRRDFLNYSLTFTGGMTLANNFLAKNLSTRKSLGGKDSKKPNILFIMTDEFNPDVAGPYGNGIARTPSLNKLAREGVTFDNCYTNCPLCCPSRLSFISGKYPSQVGVWGNQCWLPDENYPTIAPLLQKNGYDTVLSGKMHFDKSRRYGFRELFPGWENAHTKSGLVERRAPDDTSINYGSWKARARSFHPGDNNRHIIGHDKKVTEHASRYIKKRSKDDDPFL